MGEILQKQMRVGFLLQPNSANTVGTDNPVGVYTSGNSWDNPQGVSAGYFEMLATVGNINPDSKVENYTLNATGSNSMFMEESRAKTNSKSVLPTIDLEMYATPKVLAGLFGIALQDFSNYDPSEVSVGKYIKPYNTTIDFTSAGYLLTVAGGGINVGSGTSDGFILQNALVNNMTLTIPNVTGGEARLAKVSCQLIGQTLLEGQYLTGTWSSAESYIYNQSEIDYDHFQLDLTVTGNGVTNAYTDLCWRNFVLTINNNITSDCFTADGANNFKRVNPEITASIDIPHNNVTVDTFAQYKAGASVSFTLGNGYTAGSLDGFNGDGTGQYLEIKSTKAQMTANPRSTEGDYIAQKIDLNILKPTAGWGDYLISLDDNYDWACLPTVVA